MRVIRKQIGGVERRSDGHIPEYVPASRHLEEIPASTRPEMTDQPPYLVKLGDAQTAVVRALFNSLPDRGWDSCTVEYRKAGAVAESRVGLTGSDGTTVVVKSPAPMVMALKRLRESMAGQGHGAWLSATLTAKPDGECSFDYNYDVRPNWTVQPTDETYIEDLAKYPRPADQIPDWYPRAK